MSDGLAVVAYQAVARERARAEAAEQALAQALAQLAAERGGTFVATDGTDDLPAPTGVGGELIIATVNGQPQLEDIHYNGRSI